MNRGITLARLQLPFEHEEVVAIRFAAIGFNGIPNFWGGIMPRTSFNVAVHGFHFANNFITSANRIGSFPDLKFGGLCGGMSYASLDHYFANKPTPTQDFLPTIGSPLEAYIFDRQQDSVLRSAANLGRWAELLVNPFGWRNGEFYGWGIAERLSELRRSIDAGRPVPLGLKSAGGNGDHQVVAVGYEVGRYAGNKGAYQEDICIILCDPNYPGREIFMRADPFNQNFCHSNGNGERWQGYFVDSAYTSRTIPSFGPIANYPVDGLVHEIRLEIQTGSDDLRGGNDNVNVVVGLAGGTTEQFLNINKSNRWVDRGIQNVILPLKVPVRPADILEVTLSTTLGGGFNGDNWNVDCVRLILIVNNSAVPSFTRAGTPLVRFDGNNRPYVMRVADTAQRVALRTSNGINYLCAEGGGGREVVANRTSRGPWETFAMEVISVGKVALRANNGHYLCAEGGGGRELVANRPTRGVWETFALVDLGTGKVALQAGNNQFVCAEAGGGREVNANRPVRGEWESFVLEKLT
jgi:hypothetical protein